MMIFCFVFGVRHDLAYFENDRTKSEVLGHMTTQHLVLISTSGGIWGTMVALEHTQTHSPVNMYIPCRRREASG